MYLLMLIFEGKAIKKDPLILNYCARGIAAFLNGFTLLQLEIKNL
tara:strand:+ start:295 stop:429 length:135 start_codon:yes stop_codon:yes gene_type:complete